MFNFLKKKEKCSHTYISIGYNDISEGYSAIVYYVCKKCGNRYCFLDKDTKSIASGWLLDRIKLWSNGEYELIDDDVSGGLMLISDVIYLEKCWGK